jgi:hypothetical protein
LHRGRCGCRRCPVRSVFAVLRSSDRSRRATTQDTAGDYDASRNDRPHDVPVGIPDNVSDGVPDRFTIRVRDGVSVIFSKSARSGFASACQHFGFVGEWLGFVLLYVRFGPASDATELALRAEASLAKVLADMLTRREAPC